MEWKKHIIYITVMKIWISNTMVDFYLSEKTFKEKLYKGGGVLTLGAPLLIRLQSVSLQPWLLQLDHRTPPAQLIWKTIIYIKVWHKQKNNNTNYNDVKTKQVLSDSYWATTWSITKCKKNKLHFSDSWEWCYSSTH